MGRPNTPPRKKVNFLYTFYIYIKLFINFFHKISENLNSINANNNKKTKRVIINNNK